MNILAFESSCDETAVAVVRDGRTVLSDAILSQADMHALYGGVVPEIASRKHVEAIAGLTDQALADAGLTKSDVDAVAVTYAPGLIGAVLVGVSFAKSVAYALDVPLIPVHHVRGHIAANYLAFPELEPPFLALAISGGNTLIVDVRDYTDMAILGATRDDAAGECFDKAARVLGLPYPGGKPMDVLAQQSPGGKYTLPRVHVEGAELDMSFSGLKTAVVNLAHNAQQKGEPLDAAALARDFTQAVSDELVPRAMEAARRTGRQAARQALLDAYDGAMAARQITVYAAPSDSAASLRTLRQGKVARLNDVTEDGNWYQITFSGTTGYVRADGCQTVQYSDYAGTSAVKSAREDLVDYAKSFLGTRYVWGGASPSGFDCSGFTMYVYAHFGYRMSHGASDQLYAFTRVSTAERLAGDLVFFSYGGGDISHVGIYLGGGAFIHATSNGGVKISYFDGYYSSTYVGAVRILAD